MPAKFEPANWQELLIVAASIKLGLFESLDEKPATAEELAARLGYDRRATRTLLLTLAELGHLETVDGRFLVSGEMRAIAVDKDNPAYSPFSILHSWNLIERWLTIPEVVRTGRQVERPYTPERRTVFIRSMHDLSRNTAPAIVEHCLARMPERGSVLDLGGGPGTYARLFAGHGIRTTIMDQPDVVEMIEPELKDYPQISMVPGDFHQSLPPGPFDLVFMGNILHIYGPDENLRLLKRAHGVLNPGGAAAIVDMVRGRSLRAVLFAVNMLVNTESGGTWTEDEYRSWLEKAGFGDIEVLDITDRDAQLILANRPD